MPPWAAIEASGRRSIDFRAQVARASGKLSSPYHLRVQPRSRGGATVCEQQNAPQLPSFCPQRHINEDGSFCLGLNAGDVDNDTAGTEWWQRLYVFLSGQEVAKSRREWPPRTQLSHGKAGEIQVEAESVAASLGMLSALREAIEHGSGVIAYYSKRVREGRLINGRAPCVCGRIGRRNRLQLRRECFAQRQPCLPVLEHQRQEAESKFWQDLKNRRAVCCNTMKTCPLKG